MADRSSREGQQAGDPKQRRAKAPSAVDLTEETTGNDDGEVPEKPHQIATQASVEASLADRLTTPSSGRFKKRPRYSQFCHAGISGSLQLQIGSNSTRRPLQTLSTTSYKTDDQPLSQTSRDSGRQQIFAPAGVVVSSTNDGLNALSNVHSTITGRFPSPLGTRTERCFQLADDISFGSHPVYEHDTTEYLPEQRPAHYCSYSGYSTLDSNGYQKPSEVIPIESAFDNSTYSFTETLDLQDISAGRSITEIPKFDVDQSLEFHQHPSHQRPSPWDSHIEERSPSRYRHNVFSHGSAGSHPTSYLGHTSHVKNLLPHDAKSSAEYRPTKGPIDHVDTMCVADKVARHDVEGRVNIKFNETSKCCRNTVDLELHPYGDSVDDNKVLQRGSVVVADGPNGKSCINSKTDNVFVDGKSPSSDTRDLRKENEGLTNGGEAAWEVTKAGAVAKIPSDMLVDLRSRTEPMNMKACIKVLETRILDLVNDKNALRAILPDHQESVRANDPISPILYALKCADVPAQFNRAAKIILRLRLQEAIPVELWIQIIRHVTDSSNDETKKIEALRHLRYTCNPTLKAAVNEAQWKVATIQVGRSKPIEALSPENREQSKKECFGAVKELILTVPGKSDDRNGSLYDYGQKDFVQIIGNLNLKAITRFVLDRFSVLNEKATSLFEKSIEEMVNLRALRLPPVPKNSDAVTTGIAFSVSTGQQGMTISCPAHANLRVVSKLLNRETRTSLHVTFFGAKGQNPRRDFENLFGEVKFKTIDAVRAVRINMQLLARHLGPVVLAKVKWLSIWDCLCVREFYETQSKKENSMVSLQWRDNSTATSSTMDTKLQQSALDYLGSAKTLRHLDVQSINQCPLFIDSLADHIIAMEIKSLSLNTADLRIGHSMLSRYMNWSSNFTSLEFVHHPLAGASTWLDAGDPGCWERESEYEISIEGLAAGYQMCQNLKHIAISAAKSSSYMNQLQEPLLCEDLAENAMRLLKDAGIVLHTISINIRPQNKPGFVGYPRVQNCTGWHMC